MQQIVKYGKIFMGATDLKSSDIKGTFHDGIMSTTLPFPLNQLMLNFPNRLLVNIILRRPYTLVYGRLNVNNNQGRAY